MVTEPAKTARRSARPRPLASLLVATDFSTSAARALERAARLAVRTDARITVVHVLPALLSSRKSRTMEAASRRSLDEALAQVADVVPQARVDGLLVSGTPYVEIARQARAVRADLVVMGRTGPHPVRDLLLGSTAEQVVRNGGTPVLLVRTRADRAYSRPLFALEIDESAAQIVESALRILPSPPPLLHVVHADDFPLVELAYSGMSDVAIARDRARRSVEARRQMYALLARGERADLRWSITIRDGAPHTQIVREVSRDRPDLLVLGTHGRSGPAYAMLGSVAGEVLREVSCDTYVTRPGPVTIRRP